MVRTLTIIALLAVSSAHAHADDDVGAVVAQVCDGSTKAPLCNDTKLAPSPRPYPRQYYEARHPGVCKQLADETVASGHDLKAKVDRACSTSLTHFTSASEVSTLGIDLVQGLGDLLVAEAKTEALDYLLREIGQRFCTFTLVVDAKHAVSISMSAWFANTCKVIMPGGKIDVDAFTFVDLETQFRADLVALSGNVGTLAVDWIGARWSDGATYAKAIGAILGVALEIAHEKHPAQILQDLADKAKAELGGKLACDLTSAKTATKACAIVLGLELARTATNEHDETDSKKVTDAFDQFCASYGAPGKQTQGSCVVDPATYDAVHTDLLAILRAVDRVLDLDLKLATLKKTTFASELSKLAAPEWSGALRQLVDALGLAAEGVLPDAAAKLKQDFAFVDLGFDAADAIIAADPGAIRAALMAILKSDLLAAKLSANQTRAISVVIGLGTAKDRAEVKGILADATAPIGTWRMKYGAEHAIWTVNGFVGVLAGGELRLHDRDGNAVDRAPFKLAAPIGIDVTVASCDRFNIGVGATVIDPLALDVTSKNSTLSADWKTLVDLGAYVRVDVLHSPFSVLLGGSWKPGRRADEGSCGTQRCYDGAFQLGAFLSVDVPLIVLH